MILKIILNRYFQIRYGSTKAAVHSSGEALPRVLSTDLFTRKKNIFFCCLHEQKKAEEIGVLPEIYITMRTDIKERIPIQVKGDDGL